MTKQEIKNILDSNLSEENKIIKLQSKGMELEEIFNFILKNYK